MANPKAKDLVPLEDGDEGVMWSNFARGSLLKSPLGNYGTVLSTKHFEAALYHYSSCIRTKAIVIIP